MEPPAPTATPTATPFPSLKKSPALQNLFLTRQSAKIPPVQCVGPQGSSDVAVLTQSLSQPIMSLDPKAPSQQQQLGAFEFEVHYDESKVCVELQLGPAASGMTCFVQDDVTKPVLEGVARIGCVTLGKTTTVNGTWEFFGDFGFATVVCSSELLESPGLLVAEGPCSSASIVLNVGNTTISGQFDQTTGSWDATVPCSVCTSDPPLMGTFDLEAGTFQGTIGPILSSQLPPFASVVGTKVADHSDLSRVLVRPRPDVYSQAIPNQGNGVVAQLLNQKCELADLQGHPIALFSCDDADVTIRYLEGDVEPDCVVNTLDTQAIAFRWGAGKGGLLFLDRFNLEPFGAQSDDDIDIKDLQVVYGRIGSTCAAPHPEQPPVNPKA